MRKLLTLLFTLVATPLFAQALIVSNIPGNSTGGLYGATCPPVANPGTPGIVYTCTGSGALYTWTGASWSLVSGSGVIGGSIADTQIAVGSGSATIAGSNNFIKDSDGNVRLSSSSSTTQGYLLDVVSESSSAANPEQFYPRMLHSIFNMDGTGTITNKRVMPLDGEVYNNSTGRIDWSSSAELYAENISTGTWGTMMGAGARLFNDGSATVDEMVGFQTSPADHFQNGNYGGGTVTSYTAFESNGVNDNGTYGAVYGLHIKSQVGLTVTGNNHAINYNDTFVVDSAGAIVNGIAKNIEVQGEIADVNAGDYSAPTLAGVGAGNVSNGTHRYKFTLGNNAGTIQTSNTGTATAAVTVTDNTTNGKVTVNVPGVCDAYYPFVYVYRDKNSDGVYKLVGDLNATCEKTFLDNVADGSLGATIPTTNNTLGPIISVVGGNVVLPSRLDANENQTLMFSAITNGNAGPYIGFHPEDRLTTATPIKGFIIWGGYNLVPASIDYAEGGQLLSQGGQDTSGGLAAVYGGAAYSNDSADFQGGAYYISNGGTATAGGAFELHSGSSFAAGNINGGDGLLQGGDKANGGHLGDLTISNWRNVPVSFSGTMTLTGTVVSGGSGLAVANVGANSCGTTAASVAGGPNSFEVTVGATSGTQCRVAFPTAAPTRWNCTASNTTTAALVRATGVDTTHVDLLGVFTAADVLAAVCVPR